MASIPADSPDNFGPLPNTDSGPTPERNITPGPVTDFPGPTENPQGAAPGCSRPSHRPHRAWGFYSPLPQTLLPQTQMSALLDRNSPPRWLKLWPVFLTIP